MHLSGCGSGWVGRGRGWREWGIWVCEGGQQTPEADRVNALDWVYEDGTDKQQDREEEPNGHRVAHVVPVGGADGGEADDDL